MLRVRSTVRWHFWGPRGKRTLEGKEDEESKIVTGLCRARDVIEETEVIVGT
jgi:hypothetical protein